MAKRGDIMNESELVAETIATVKRDGWVRGWLAHPDGGHCILGAIGRARWGKQWDIDCLEEDGKAYERLSSDPVTRSVVHRVYEHLVHHGAMDLRDVTGEGYDIDGEQTTVYMWNDRLHWNDRLRETDILEVLEKVQAEL